MRRILVFYHHIYDFEHNLYKKILVFYNCIYIASILYLQGTVLHTWRSVSLSSKVSNKLTKLITSIAQADTELHAFLWM